MPARHEEIADELRRAIDREEYTVGSLLPRGDDLAASTAWPAARSARPSRP